MRFMTLPPLQYRENILLRITSNVDNYNMFTAAGSPDRIVKVVLILEAGLIIGSTDTAVASLQTGSGWKAGSKLIFVSKASVIGAGGAGGEPATLAGSASPACYDVSAAGGTGGDAMNISYPITIDNTGGNIYGGGGGGSAGKSHASGFAATSQGGGGGGGAGKNGGAASINVGNSAPAFVGTNGAAGGASGGTGGVGATDTTVGGVAQSGGSGGEYGAPGNASTLGTNQNLNYCATVSTAVGAAGKAINLNGNTVTWLGGNNSSQVKGAVS